MSAKKQTSQKDRPFTPNTERFYSEFNNTLLFPSFSSSTTRTAAVRPDEGQLALDIFQNEKELVIVTTIAGVKPEDIDISLDADMLTIRGQRTSDFEVDEEDYFYHECHWGAFSRSIILPLPVKNDQAKATFKNSVLTIRIPKEVVNKKIPVAVVEE